MAVGPAEQTPEMSSKVALVASVPTQELDPVTLRSRNSLVPCVTSGDWLRNGAAQAGRRSKSFCRRGVCQGFGKRIAISVLLSIPYGAEIRFRSSAVNRNESSRAPLLPHKQALRSEAHEWTSVDGAWQSGTIDRVLRLALLGMSSTAMV